MGEPLAFDACIIGGCGRVGLPFALALADGGMQVAAVDVDRRAVESVAAGRMPFFEPGCEEILARVVGRCLIASVDPGLVVGARWVVVVVGSAAADGVVEGLLGRLRAGQTLILRTTLPPGTTDRVASRIDAAGIDVRVAYCPERVAEGHALAELATLPQLVGARDDATYDAAEGLFRPLGVERLRLSPVAAELAKLFGNAWRSVQFAAANEMLKTCAEAGVDYHEVRDAMTRGYPRLAGLPAAGFAEGPCLGKDAKLLDDAARSPLVRAAREVNTGLPAAIVAQVRDRYGLRGKVVGLLGLAFKADVDDLRDSQAARLRLHLEAEGATVLGTDPAADGWPLEEVLRRAEILVVGVPHSSYRGIEIPGGVPLIDVWDLFGRGVFST